MTTNNRVTAPGVIPLVAYDKKPAGSTLYTALSPELLAKAAAMACSMDQVALKPTAYLTGQAIPEGKITLLIGPTGTGKSLTIEGLIADLSRGRSTIFDMADGCEEGEILREPLTTLYLAAEDARESVIKANLASADADQSKVIVPDDTYVSLCKIGSPYLQALLEVYHPDFLIIDPWTRFYDLAGRSGMTAREGVVTMMDTIRDLMTRYNVRATILTGNTNKPGQYSGRGAADAYGSQQLVDACRSCWMSTSTHNPADPDEICLEDVKSNQREIGNNKLLLRKNRVRGRIEFKGLSDLGYNDYVAMADGSIKTVNAQGRAAEVILSRMQSLQDGEEMTREEMIDYVIAVAQCSRSTVRDALRALGNAGKIILPGSGRGRGEVPLRLPEPEYHCCDPVEVE